MKEILDDREKALGIEKGKNVKIIIMTDGILSEKLKNPEEILGTGNLTKITAILWNQQEMIKWLSMQYENTTKHPIKEAWYMAHPKITMGIICGYIKWEEVYNYTGASDPKVYEIIEKCKNIVEEESEFSNVIKAGTGMSLEFEKIMEDARKETEELEYLDYEMQTDTNKVLDVSLKEIDTEKEIIIKIDDKDVATFNINDSELPEGITKDGDTIKIDFKIFGIDEETEDISVLYYINKDVLINK